MSEASTKMDVPTDEETIKASEFEDVKLEEVNETKTATIEEVEEDDAQFHCTLIDAEMVQKVAVELLPGLASACIDNTTGGMFKSPASVAVDMRREMVDYLVQRSEMFVAESVVLEGDSVTEVSDNPHEIILDFIDDFAQSKRNLFSKVSAWMLSERREEQIDDFVQQLEMNGFWLIARRVAVAQTVIRNIDFKNIYHCSMKFKSEEELSKHISSCGYRELHCENEGCNARFSAAHLELHDSTCQFKILQCEQKCPETLMRREMDRHCITVCPMKLANCPFYPVGCVSTIPQCKTDQHRLENLQSHLIHILKLMHKEASFEALKKRAEQLLEASSPGRLATARDARSLTVAIKSIDAKLGPLVVEDNIEDNTEDNAEDNAGGAESKDGKKDSTDLSTKKDSSIDSSRNDEQSPDVSKGQHNSTASPLNKIVSPDKSENVAEPTVKTDSTNEHSEKADSRDLLHNKSDSLKSPEKSEQSLSTSKKHQDSTTSAHKLESSKSEDPPKSHEKKHHDSTTSEDKKDGKKDSTDLSTKKDSSIDSSRNDEQSPDVPKGQHNSTASPDKIVSDKSENVAEPTVKTDSTNEHREKADSRDLLHNNKSDSLKSPDKSEQSLSTSKKHQDFTTSAHKSESSQSEDPPKSHEKHHTTSAHKSESSKSEDPPKSHEKHHTTSAHKSESSKSEDPPKSHEKHHTTSAHKLESSKSEDPPKSHEKHHDSTASEDKKE